MLIGRIRQEMQTCIAGGSVVYELRYVCQHLITAVGTCVKAMQHTIVGSSINNRRTRLFAAGKIREPLATASEWQRIRPDRPGLTNKLGG